MRSITISGQQFTKVVSPVNMPYLDQLAGYYLLGGSASQSLTNLAFGASQNLTEIVSPVYSTGYATVNAVNGFETNFLLDTPFTQFCVAFLPAAASGVAAFTRGAGNADGFDDMLVYDSGGSQVTGYPDENAGQSIPSLPITTGFFFVAQTWGGTGTRHAIYAMSGSTFTGNASSNSTPKTITPTHTIKIGSGYGVGTPNLQVALAGFATSVFNMEQLYRMALFSRSLLAVRGITML